MVASVLFQPTSLNEDIPLTVSSSILSLTSADDDDDDDDDANHIFVVSSKARKDEEEEEEEEEAEYTTSDVCLDGLCDDTHDNENDNVVIDDDDTTILYDNTTSTYTMNHIEKQQRLRRHHHQQQPKAVLVLEEQRILQTSPSSVVVVAVSNSTRSDVVNCVTTSTSSLHGNKRITNTRTPTATTTATAITHSHNPSNHHLKNTKNNDTTKPISIPTLKNCRSTASFSTSSSASSSSSAMTPPESLIPTTVPIGNTHVTVASNTSYYSPSFSKTTVVQKPFFIMDFLEDIDPTVLTLVQQSLQQQQHQTKQKQPKPPTPLPEQRREHHHCHHIHQIQSPVILQPSSAAAAAAASSSFTSWTDTTTTTTTTLDWNETTRSMYGNEVTTTTDDCHFIPLQHDHSLRSSSSLPFLSQSIQRGQQYYCKGIRAAQEGNWNKALRYWFDALEVRHQLQSSTTTAMPFQMDIADTYHNIGIAYRKLEQYDTALSYLDVALEMRMDAVTNNGVDVADAIKSNDDNDNPVTDHVPTTMPQQDRLQQQQQQQMLHMNIASSLRTIGNIYQKQNQLSLAIQFYIKCKLVQEQLIPTSTTLIDMARTCNVIGHTYAMGQVYSDAYEAYHDAVMIFQQLWNRNTYYYDNHNYDNDDSNHYEQLYHSEYQMTLFNLRLMEQKQSSCLS